jgi:quercetin dioxygenase-like cupin family protein
MMAIPHAAPGEVIELRPQGPTIDSDQTRTLFKTGSLEVIRLVLHQGKHIATHIAPGELTLQCLTGQATIGLTDRSCDLAAGTILYLAAGQPHSVQATDDTTLLLTIALPAKA